MVAKVSGRAFERRRIGMELDIGRDLVGNGLFFRSEVLRLKLLGHVDGHGEKEGL